MRGSIALNLERDLAARIAFGREVNFPGLRKLLCGKNGFRTGECCFGNLEEFAAEISRDSDFGNCIALLCVASVDLEFENCIGALQGSSDIETLTQGMSNRGIRTGGAADCLVEESDNVSRRHSVLDVLLYEFRSDVVFLCDCN